MEEERGELQRRGAEVVAEGDRKEGVGDVGTEGVRERRKPEESRDANRAAPEIRQAGSGLNQNAIRRPAPTNSRPSAGLMPWKVGASFCAFPN